MKGLNPNQYQTVYICLSTISMSECYRQLCDILGLKACGSKTAQQNEDSSYAMMLKAIHAQESNEAAREKACRYQTSSTR